ncbi:MAG: hypothetical protein ACKORF_06780 [Micrococcales bacterium]
MTNITARKGLAFGALIALGSTLLAGAPAHAAAGVTLAPSAGTSYSLPAGYGFTLTATASSEIPTDRFDEFKFKIVNVDGKDAEAYTYSSDWNYNGDYVNASGDAGSSHVVSGYAPGGNGVNNGKIWLESNDNDDTSHYVVTAWLDANGNDSVDAGELSATQTVTFLKAADISATTKVDAPIYAGEDVVSGHATLNNINVEQWDGNDYNNADTSIKFKGDLTTLGEPTASYNSTDKDFEASQSVSPVSKGLVVSAQVEIYINGAWTTLGSAATTTVLGHSVSTLSGSATATANNTKFSGPYGWGYYENYAATNSANSVKFTALDGDDKAVAGKTVKVYFDDSWFDSALSADNGISVTINGVKYTDSSKLPGVGSTAPLSLTTDAKGEVTLNFSSTGLTDGDYLGYYAQSENNVYSDYYYTYQDDRSYTAHLSNSTTNEFGAVAGGTTNVSAVVYDQFGGLLANGYDARVSLVNSDRSDTDATDATNSFQAAVDGKVSFKVVDNGKGTGYNHYVVNFEKRDTVNGGYTGGSVASRTFDINYVDSADLVAGKFVPEYDYINQDDNGVWQYNSGEYGASNNRIDVDTNDFGNYNGYAVLGTQPSTNWGSYFAGYIRSADTSSYAGAYVPGQTVTLSGAGLQFRGYQNDNDAWDLYATDSITLTTYENGWFGVYVTSHKAGLNSFTLTAGGLTQKVEFYVDVPAWDSGSNITITAPVFSLPAKNIVASAVVTDKFGNVVPEAPATLKLTGLSNPSYWNWIDYEADDNGQVALDINPGINDLGTITWTATLYSNYGYSADDADKIVKTATTVVALGAVVPADAKVSVASAATSQSGRAVDVTVTVTTAAGVAIPGAIVNLSAAGAGYLGATSATTDAAGKASVKLVGGANEIGDAVVTATAGAVSASAKTTFGVTDANINLAGKRVTVDWSFAAGKRVVIYRNGIQIRNFVAGSDASDSFSFNLKKGTRKIAVKIGGVTIDTQVYVIK